MKPNMARIMPTVLRACMYAAVEEGRLTGNPAARVGKFVGRTRVEVDIFTREELTRLLVTAAGALVHHHHGGPVWASHSRNE
jgi:hypothetical protein